MGPKASASYFYLRRRIITIQHRLIPDAQLHEPKGVVSAPANTAYFADGAGSGSWKEVGAAQLAGITSDGGQAGLKLISDGANGWIYRRDTAYGSLTITNNTNGFAVSAASDPTLQNTADYVLFTGTGAPWASENLFGFTATPNALVAPVTGVYHLNAYANISGFPTNTASVGARFRINGTTFSSRTTITKSNSAGDSGQLIGMGLVPMNAGDFIQIYVASTANGNLTIRNHNLTMWLLRQTA